MPTKQNALTTHPPVPGTGKHRHGRAFRRIRYGNARRAAQFFGEEGEVGSRPARSRSNLPDAWEDMQLPRQRNWKNYRRKQWRR
ncbi:hypothetical protein [Herbaspirillum sp.]|uniref:hypothetical protein n=1 Tax=Herbaspirillum sp. TaxID=1890675 RepID=UPI001B11299F|nr:hypothetical protein [Herbaspirillum sp.]MBO9538067.1 hypothetical protein [Herbaspirillum sp.]